MWAKTKLDEEKVTSNSDRQVDRKTTKIYLDYEKNNNHYGNRSKRKNDNDCENNCQ